MEKDDFALESTLRSPFHRMGVGIPSCTGCSGWRASGKGLRGRPFTGRD